MSTHNLKKLSAQTDSVPKQQKPYSDILEAVHRLYKFQMEKEARREAAK
jgi:hypothetical protein